MKRIPKIIFENDLDLSKLDKFIGKSCLEIVNELSLDINLTSKSFARTVLEKMISKCDIKIDPTKYQYKMIRVNQYGEAKNPSPFKVTEYYSIIMEEWETSEFKRLLQPTYIFFTITHGNPNESIFKGYVFYDFTEDDLRAAKYVWTDTKEKIKNGTYDLFLTDKDTGTFFFKMHAQNTSCQMDAPRTGKEITRSFWISRKMISRIISSIR